MHNLPLTHWDTTLVADGPYEIRVSASSVGGAESHTVGVTVDNTTPIALLDLPVNCDWVNGEVEIYGLATDANMARWDIQWTGGPSNTWNTISWGTGSDSGLLATWDVSGLPHCAYTIRLIARDAARINCTNDAHWTEFFVSINVGCVADLDGDGDVDLSDLAELLGRLRERMSVTPTA